MEMICCSCERSPADVVVTFSDGPRFEVCMSCSDDGFDGEVSVLEAFNSIRHWEVRTPARR